MTYDEFLEQSQISREELARVAWLDNRQAIKAKREKTALKNLALIFDAVLAISQAKGFAAMTMRDLSQQTGLSLGALYDYVGSKDHLLSMLQNAGRKLGRQALDQAAGREPDPWRRLTAVVAAHLYASEALAGWFYFSYMEARHLGPREREAAIRSEQASEKVLALIMAEGCEQGRFAKLDHGLLAASLKAMLQDWYIKRGKYARRGITVEAYAEHVIGLMQCRLQPDRSMESQDAA